MSAAMKVSMKASWLLSKVSSSQRDLSRSMYRTVSECEDPSSPPSSPSPAGGIAHSASMPVLSCNNCLQYRQEIEKMKTELTKAHRELRATHRALDASQKSEKSLRERLSAEAHSQIKSSVRFEDVSQGENRPMALVNQYGALCSETRLDALDSLDNMSELNDLDNLKNKLLFSIIVLSFRHCHQRLQQIKEKILSAVGVKKSCRSSFTSELETAGTNLENSVMAFFRQTLNTYDMKNIIEDVQAQIYATLYDYPCLKACSKLKLYIYQSVRIAWKLTVQNPPAQIEFDCKTFDPDKHVRFHSSNGDSDQVKSYIWPSLLEAHSGHCLHKGMVIT